MRTTRMAGRNALAALVALLALAHAACAHADSGSSSASSVALDTPASTSASAPALSEPFPCNWEAPDGTYFDFSALTTTSGTTAEGSNNDIYNVNVCGPTPGVPACEGASVCFEFKYFVGVWYAIANYAAAPAPTYSLVTPANVAGGVQLSFNNGQFEGTPVQVIMKFMCSTGATQYVPLHDSQNHWTVTVNSEHACPKPKPSSGSSKGGLSGGWIFVIIVLVCTSVYVIGGCIFKHQKQGTQGMESCPNIDFWREFPSLVKDGIGFSIFKTKQFIAKMRGGAGASGGQYDTMK